jgi:hypothetical protein
MHGAKAGRLDQNTRVNFGLVGKTDSPFRQFVDIDAATPNFAVDDRAEATGSGAMRNRTSPGPFPR